MSDQDNITTLRVRREAQNLKLALIDFIEAYPLDGRAIRVLTTLNTRNFNYVLNTLAPKNSSWQEVNPKLMAYVKNYIKAIIEPAQQQPNQGPKWWQDVNATVDPDARPPNLPTLGMFGQMEVEGEQQKRGRSPHGENEEWAHFRQSLDELTEDINSDRYSLVDISVLGKKWIRYQKAGSLPHDGVSGEGRFSQWEQLKKHISCLNILKCAKLVRLDEQLSGYWEQGLDDRPANHLNAILGKEIDRLIEIARYYYVDQCELDRHAQQRIRYWKMCPNNDIYDASCGLHGDRCRHLHGRDR